MIKILREVEYCLCEKSWCWSEPHPTKPGKMEFKIEGLSIGVGVSSESLNTATDRFKRRKGASSVLKAYTYPATSKVVVRGFLQKGKDAKAGTSTGKKA
jgi:hypothetical protein